MKYPLRKFITVICVLLFSIAGQSQPMFNRDYTTPGFACGTASHLQTEDGGILFLTRMFHLTGAAQSAVMFRTDAMGALQWELNIDMLAYIEEMSNVVRSPDSSFFFASYEFGGAFNIIRVDGGGTLIFNNTIPVPLGYANNGTPVCLARNDGTFLIAGTLMDQATSDFVWLVMSVDHNGNLLWSQMFNRNAAKVTHRDIDTCANGDIVLLGEWADFSTVSFGPCICRITSGGMLLWSKSYFQSSTNLQAQRICVMPGDFIFVAGYTYSFASGHNECFVSRFTGQGNEIRTLRYGGDTLVVREVLESNDHLLLLGESESDGFLYEIDSSGIAVWGKLYPNCKPWDVAQSTTCGYTITASTSTSTQLNGMRAFSAGLYGNACVHSVLEPTKTQLTMFAVTVGSESALPMTANPEVFPVLNNLLAVATNCFITGIEEPNEESAISIFPVPADQIVRITSDEIIVQLEIRDLQGRTVYQQQSATSDAEVFTGNFPVGIYVLQVTTDSGITSHKMAVAR